MAEILKEIRSAAVGDQAALISKYASEGNSLSSLLFFSFLFSSLLFSSLLSIITTLNR